MRKKLAEIVLYAIFILIVIQVLLIFAEIITYAANH